MQNFVFVSPNFPEVYYKFLIELRKVGFNVLVITDCPWYELSDNVKNNCTEYYYVHSLANTYEMENALHHFINKYGPISYLESNNEFWLMQDAYLREKFNIPNGLRPIDMECIKYKSKMKSNFINAGVKVARYIIPTNYEETLNFIKEVDYPVFVKPDNGVGANDSFAIHNIEQLNNFFARNDHHNFIMEEFIDGTIMSFDGISDDDGNVLICFNEIFPIPCADVANKDIDDYYYALVDFDKEFLEMGKRVVKAFNIKKRCFHIEFFKLNTDKKGLAKKNEIIALEVNMRPPGGNTPDLLSVALNSSFYTCYAEMMMFNEIRTELSNEHFIAITASRKDRFNYIHSHIEILEKYNEQIFDYGRYNKEVALVMGNSYYYAKFKDLNDALEFANFIEEKQQIN